MADAVFALTLTATRSLLYRRGRHTASDRQIQTALAQTPHSNPISDNTHKLTFPAPYRTTKITFFSSDCFGGRPIPSAILNFQTPQ
jgi:hypothetical protein